jgi:hypothetical protein
MNTVHELFSISEKLIANSKATKTLPRFKTRHMKNYFLYLHSLLGNSSVG